MINKTPRHLSRIIALQTLYHYNVNNNDMASIELFIKSIDDKITNKTNWELVDLILKHSISEFNSLLELYKPFLKRDLEEINIIEKCILVIAACELKYNHSVHYKVIINEAIELAKLFAAPESYKFINNLVDKLAHNIKEDN